MPPAPPEARLILAGTFLLLALVGWLLTLPLVRRRVPMNRLYGVRIPKAFTSEANWYAVNEYGGRQFLGYFAALAAVGGLFGILPFAPDRWYFWPLLLAPLWLLVPVLWRVFAYARRLP